MNDGNVEAIGIDSKQKDDSTHRLDKDNEVMVNKQRRANRGAQLYC